MNIPARGFSKDHFVTSISTLSSSFILFIKMFDFSGNHLFKFVTFKCVKRNMCKTFIFEHYSMVEWIIEIYCPGLPFAHKTDKCIFFIRQLILSLAMLDILFLDKIYYGFGKFCRFIHKDKFYIIIIITPQPGRKW